MSQVNSSRPSGTSQTKPDRRGPRRVAVRYGKMGFIGDFSYPASLELRAEHNTVVIQTDRGIEIGQTLNITSPQGFGTVRAGRQAMMRYLEEAGTEYFRPNNGRILRLASDQDLNELAHINRDAAEKLEFCRRLVAEQKLSMELVDCEHIFGGERIVFYFMAEGRIDFRSLVKHLAREYQTRIEMRQIGSRDEARLLADYEICGRECCCRSFLKTLRPVSMKMAKTQKATLDPSKVSGRCGRLRCCLRYEHVAYEDLIRRLPKIGSWVRTAETVGRVIGTQVLTQLVMIEDDRGSPATVSVEDLVERNVAPPQRPPAEPPPRPRRESAPAPETPTGEEPADPSSRAKRKRRRRRRKSKSTAAGRGNGGNGSSGG